jgi:hypothetical protein
MAPFWDVNTGVAEEYWKVRYGDPGTRYEVIVDEPVKYCTVTD